MKPTAKQRLIALLALSLLPLLLIMLIGQKESVQVETVSANQSGVAIPFEEIIKPLIVTTTTTTIPPTTTTTVPPTTTTTRPEPVVTTTTVAPAPPAPRGSVNWDAVARCESGGNWATNTGNGYYGGLQFDLQTWQSTGGSGYPHQNSREEQIHRADILYQSRGLSPWPICGKYG